MTPEQIVALVSALAAVLTGVYTFRLQKRKVDSDVWDKAMDAMDQAMVNLRIDNDFLRKQDEKSRETISMLEANYSVLQETLNTALDRIKVLECEKAGLVKANNELTKRLSAGIDSLIERRSRKESLV